MTTWDQDAYGEIARAAFRPVLVDDLFDPGGERRKERERLDRVYGPLHGPWPWEIVNVVRRGRIVAYYKGREHW